MRWKVLLVDLEKEENKRVNKQSEINKERAEACEAQGHSI